ncbi:MAG: helix-turn-helix domain-containing protein [Patescibacteria group bacterium]|nr:helix-turn-helix domain-containing protein [Patescibacteria group bacterium]
MKTGFIQTQILKIGEVAVILRISKPTIYRMVESGRIPAYKIGGSLRFKLAEISTYLEKCKIKPAN